MDWLNIHTSTLDSPEFVGASPVERSTWLCLQRVCIGQENGGRIVGARRWKDRQWQQLARVTLREVSAACGLWRWDGEDLVVSFYPTAKEAEVKAKRAAGVQTARKRWSDGAAVSSASSLVASSADSSAISLGPPERDAEGKGMEEEGNNLPLPPAGGKAAGAAESGEATPKTKPRPAPVPLPPIPAALDTPAFRTAWADWLRYRSQRHLAAYKPIGLQRLFAELGEWGESAAVASIAESIRNNWQGLFPPRSDPGRGPGPKRLESDMGIDELKRRYGANF